MIIICYILNALMTWQVEQIGSLGLRFGATRFAGSTIHYFIALIDGNQPLALNALPAIDLAALMVCFAPDVCI